MKLRVYNSQTGIVLWEGSADDEQAALDAAAREAGYSDDASIPDELRSPFIVVGDVEREASCIDKRRAIDEAKASFAAANGLVGASNSAITKAWKRAGNPGL